MFARAWFFVWRLERCSAQADDQQIVGTARKTLQAYEKAIISLSAVIKIEAKGREIPGLDQEHKTQCVAAIIDPSGLAIASLTNLARMYRINRRGGQTSNSIARSRR